MPESIDHFLARVGERAIYRGDYTLEDIQRMRRDLGAMVTVLRGFGWGKDDTLQQFLAKLKHEATTTKRKSPTRR